MNSAQFFGIIIFSIGILLYIVGSIAIFFLGKEVMGLLFSAGTLLLCIGILVILISVVFERIRDVDRDKERFGKREGRK